MPRILHTADWQIGRQYPAFEPDSAVPMAAARLQAVHTLAELAATHQVDAVVVAGDVFDAQTVSDKTVRQLFAAMAAWSGPWVLLPGNHDAALAESVWTRAQRLGVVPAHVHLALSPEVIELAAARLAVLPAPLRQRHTHQDLTAWFDQAETLPGWSRVGVAHGSVSGLLAEGIDSANPLSPDRTQRARLDYLALGDWHGTRRVDARTWYSGTPEPDRFRNNEAGQALLVTWAAPGDEPTVQALPTATYRWRQLEAVLQQPTDVDTLVAQLSACGRETVLDLALSGHLDLADTTRLDAALAEAEARVTSLRVTRDALHLQPTEADLAALQADGYVGEVVVALRDEAAAGSTVAQDALVQLAALLRAQPPHATAQVVSPSAHAQGGAHAAA